MAGMMPTFQILEFAHVLGAVTILGTGMGIAFFMIMAHRTGDARHIALTASAVVVADAVFTAPAVLAQPMTGFMLLRERGWVVVEDWVLATLVLYGVAAMAWLPVVRMQIQMRGIARGAAAAGRPLPASYHRLYRLWGVAGIPGFGSVLVILWLMLAKPSL